MATAATPPSGDPTKTLQTLSKSGLYSSSVASENRAAKSATVPEELSASVTPELGLSVVGPTADLSVSMKPLGKFSAVSGHEGAVVYQTTNDYSIALTDSESGDAAGYSVIRSRQAPTSYSYQILVGGQPASLKKQKDGSVLVLNQKGQTANAVDAPWAKDANGKAVTTNYTIDGNILTQSVAHKGRAYPVVADPRYKKDWLNNTIEFTKSETKTASSSAGAFGLICGTVAFRFPMGGAVCGAIAGSSVIVATQAKNSGKCLGIRWG